MPLRDCVHRALFALRDEDEAGRIDGGGGKEGIPVVPLNAVQHVGHLQREDGPVSSGSTIMRQPIAWSATEADVGALFLQPMQLATFIVALA